MDLLNIISITMNDIDGITRTINSTTFLRENFDAVQIIVDSSDHYIAEQVKAIVEEQKNAYYYYLVPSGISAAFNFGINKASGKWLWFLNGGDSVHADANMHLLWSVIEASSAEIIIFQTEYSNSGIIPKFPPIWLLWPPFVSWIPHPSTIMQRILFHDYGCFDTRYKSSMDYDFWLKVLAKNAVVNMLSYPVALFDENGISSTSNIGKKEVCKISLKYAFQILRIKLIRVRLFLSHFFAMLFK